MPGSEDESTCNGVWNYLKKVCKKYICLCDPECWSFCECPFWNICCSSFYFLVGMTLIITSILIIIATPNGSFGFYFGIILLSISINQILCGVCGALSSCKEILDQDKYSAVTTLVCTGCGLFCGSCILLITFFVAIALVFIDLLWILVEIGILLLIILEICLVVRIVRVIFKRISGKTTKVDPEKPKAEKLNPRPRGIVIDTPHPPIHRKSQTVPQVFIFYSV